MDGCTTNPTHVAKTGRPPDEVYREICALLPGPVSLETIGISASQMEDEGRALAKIAARLEQRRDGFSRVITLENGKPRAGRAPFRECTRTLA